MAEKNRADLKSYFEAGDRPKASQFVDLIDSFVNRTDDSFVATLPDATTSQKGVVEQATLPEVTAGTDTTRYVTPEGAKKAVETFAPALSPVQSVNGQTGNVVLALPDDTGWTNATLLNGFANYNDPTYQGARFRRKGGVVHIEGLVMNGAVNGVIFQLPVGYRPAKRIIFPTIINSNIIGRIDVEANGNVLANPGNPGWTSL
ncbi:MAG: hypothetical protein WCF67_05785, partial [Chitinophagaceae bacterium]